MKQKEIIVKDQIRLKKQSRWVYTRVILGEFKKENIKRKQLLRFLFPYYPIKVFRSTHMMAIMAAFLAVRILLGMFSFYVPGMNIRFGFVWIADMMMGWFFGPIFGLLLGATSDTIGFFTFGGGLWYWLYAIQEPMVCFVAGVISGWCVYRGNKSRINILFDILIIEISFVIFLFIGIFVVSKWLNAANKNAIPEAYIWPLKITVITLISVYGIIMQFLLFHHINKKRWEPFKLLTSIYAVMMNVTITLLFSFILGPLVSLEYFKWLNHGALPPGAQEDVFKWLITVGLVPRIIRESIKSPIETTITMSLLLLLTPVMRRITNNVQHQWEKSTR